VSWFAPSLGWIARRLKKHCKVISILHNVIPHEPRIFDAPLTRYFLSGCSGNVTLCDEVSADLERIRPKSPNITLFHPVYAHFGERIPREEADDILGLEHGRKNLLFFGLIREYKGLDILLEAFGKLDSSYTLIVAGEPYGSFVKYEEIINRSPAKDRIKLFTSYIKDSEVKNYFSAADLAVLPYRSATQSGISAISWHFEVPMVVTDVGGLKQAIGDSGTGLVAEKPDPDCVADEIRRFFSDDNIKTLCISSIKAEKDRLSWKSFSRKLLEFTDNLYKNP
jgi:glycosyltransferase involved in cell wall biosynthesis